MTPYQCPYLGSIHSEQNNLIWDSDFSLGGHNRCQNIIVLHQSSIAELKHPFLVTAFSTIILVFQSSSANAFVSPMNEASALSCNCVAFRLDDIQDYFLDQAQVKVVQLFREANASLTIGVIANHIGDDGMLVSFLRDSIENGDELGNQSGPVVEVANHGWNHEDFTGFDK